MTAREWGDTVWDWSLVALFTAVVFEMLYAPTDHVAIRFDGTTGKVIGQTVIGRDLHEELWGLE